MASTFRECWWVSGGLYWQWRYPKRVAAMLRNHRNANSNTSMGESARRWHRQQIYGAADRHHIQRAKGCMTCSGSWFPFVFSDRKSQAVGSMAQEIAASKVARITTWHGCAFYSDHERLLLRFFDRNTIVCENSSAVVSFHL